MANNVRDEISLVLCKYSTIAQAIERPSNVAVPRPISSNSIRLLLETLFKIFARTSKETGKNVTQLQGGVTNLLFLVSGEEEKRLIRIYGKNTDLLIDRDMENQIFAVFTSFFF